VIGSIPCILKFKVKEIDPSTGEAEEEGFDDEYQLEDIDCSPANYVKSSPTSNFTESWESLGEENEVADSYALGQRESVQEAVETVIELMGMSTCDGTDMVPPNARSHAVSMAGTVVGDVDVFIRLQFGMSADQNVAMKLSVRAEDPAFCECIHSIIQQA
jgi:coatomer protein complex subunit gamma